MSSQIKEIETLLLTWWNTDMEDAEYFNRMVRLLKPPKLEPVPQSFSEKLEKNMTQSHMILCEICGNKRCPHATKKTNDCTNSNEPGQVGSSYIAGSPYIGNR